MFYAAQGWNDVGDQVRVSLFFTHAVPDFLDSSGFPSKSHFPLLLKPYRVTCFISSIFSLSSSLTSLSSF